MEYLNLNIYNWEQSSGQSVNLNNWVDSNVIHMSKKYIYHLPHRASNISKSQEYTSSYIKVS